MRCWVEAFTIMPVITIQLKRSFYRMARDGGMGNVHMWWMWARVRGILVPGVYDTSSPYFSVLGQ